jgi:hypothetical protein
MRSIRPQPALPAAFSRFARQGRRARRQPPAHQPGGRVSAAFGFAWAVGLRLGKADAAGGLI